MSVTKAEKAASDTTEIVKLTRQIERPRPTGAHTSAGRGPTLDAASTGLPLDPLLSNVITVALIAPHVARWAYRTARRLFGRTSQ